MNASDFFELLNLDLAELSAVREAVDSEDWDGAKSALANHIRERKSPKWFYDWHNRSASVKKPDDFAKAEKLLQHEFTFGFAGAPEFTVKFDDQIDWSANPSEGEYKTHLWNESLNRHFHFANLKDAYWETGDERFAEGLVHDWIDWIEQNPRPEDSGNNVEWPYGCYAWQTLTTAIRLEASWPNALYRCLGSPAFTNDAIVAILGSICDQARHLVQWPTAHNWLTEESMGLYTAGMLFPEFREAAGWRQTAIERLYKQLTDEVYPDGAEYELAGGYGLWVVRNFVNLLERAQMNGFESELPDDMVVRMEKMFDYALSVAMPDGKMPGMNDSGNADVTALLKLGYDLFPHREDFQYVASGRQDGNAPEFTSVGLPWSGHYVMRSGWGAGDVFMQVDSGPYGSAHQHEDKLHFVLYAYGKQLVLDPGNFSYDASRWRQYVLTTPAHNTVMVDGLGQRRRGQRELFFWPRPWEGNAPPDNDTLWVSNEQFDYVRGTYRDGYGKRNDRAAEGADRPEMDEYEIFHNVTHTRHVVFVKPDYWVIADKMVASDGDEHTYESLFHLDTEEASVVDSSQTVTSTSEGVANVAIVPMADDALEVAIVKGQEDPVQGWANDPWRPVPTAIYSKSGSGVTWLAYAIYPIRAGETVPITSVEVKEENSDVLSLSVNFENGQQDDVVFSDQETVTWERRSHG